MPQTKPNTLFPAVSILRGALACPVCATLPPKPLRCGACRLQTYCSKACQRAHWPSHKSGCRLQQANEVNPKEQENIRKWTEIHAGIFSMICMSTLPASATAGTLPLAHVLCVTLERAPPGHRVHPTKVANAYLIKNMQWTFNPDSHLESEFVERRRTAIAQGCAGIVLISYMGPGPCDGFINVVQMPRDPTAERVKEVGRNRAETVDLLAFFKRNVNEGVSMAESMVGDMLRNGDAERAMGTETFGNMRNGLKDGLNAFVEMASKQPAEQTDRMLESMMDNAS